MLFLFTGLCSLLHGGCGSRTGVCSQHRTHTGVVLCVAAEQQVHWLLIIEQHSLLLTIHKSHSTSPSLLFVQVPSDHSVDEFVLHTAEFGSTWLQLLKRLSGLSAWAAPWHMHSQPLPLPFKISKHIYGNCSSCLQENRDIKKCLSLLPEFGIKTQDANSMSLSSLGTMAISLVSMVFYRDSGPLEHYSYPKYTAAIKHNTWLEEIHFMLKEFYSGTVGGRQCRKRINSL